MNTAWLMNPYVIVILIVALIVGLISGGLALLYAPNIAAAVLIGLVGLYLLVRSPFPDPWMRVGLPMILIGVALLMYFYGNEILEVFV